MYFSLSLLFSSRPGGKNHVNDLRCDTLKRIKTTDNQQFSTKEHFHQLEADKCQSGNIALKSLDGGSFNGASADAADYKYSRSLKEHKQYFIDHATNRRPCDPYAAINGDKLVNHSHEGFVTDYDDAISMNGDNSKDYMVSSSGGGGGSAGGPGMNNNSDNGRTSHRNAKRKHLSDNGGDVDNGNAIHKIYKNNCGDATAMMANKFDYMNNFDGGIRPRSFDEMQNEEHQRMIEAAENEYRVGGGAGPSSDGMNGGRCADDNNGNTANVNYASSDDLNQTNTSEHDDKNLSGSDDESGGTIHNMLIHSQFTFLPTQVLMGERNPENKCQRRLI